MGTGSGWQSVYILPSCTTQLATCIPPEHLTRSSGFKQSRDACIFEAKMSSSLKSLPEQSDESSLRPMIDVCCDGGGGRKRLRRQANHYCSHAPDLLATAAPRLDLDRSPNLRDVDVVPRVRGRLPGQVTAPSRCTEAIPSEVGGGEGIESRVETPSFPANC